MNLKLIGSSLIISGTALGAGMLAIPMVLAQFGLIWGTALMLLIFVGTTYAALLLLEASINVGGGLGMNTIARKSLGKGGQLVTNGLLYALLICLLMAYILGAGDLLNKLLRNVGLNLSLVQSQIAFTLVSGVIVASGTAVIDKLNRVLFAVMLFMLLLTLVFLVPGIELDNLLQVSNSNGIELVQTSAIIFTSFGFMVVIPSLVSYNHEATPKQLRNMVIIGSAIPLVCYLVWLYAVVGNLTPEQITHFSNVSELISVFSAEHAFINLVLSSFTGLALLTSFLGVAMALFTQNEDTFKQNKAVTYVISFILPLLGAVYAADQFLSVLSYAGIILVFLAVFVPLAMVVQLRKVETQTKGYLAEGGVAMLIFSFVFGTFLLVSQVI
ncbi:MULTISPECIES: amino acid permease [Aliivibrio]|uniref:Tyrosine transporter n=1 Tax=Aliivibrio finisterrensis TaxID=511998 RepID=A0A4Q5KL47_9GAMM|nr:MULTISPECIES: aromatic amino acid transport family protein [Aliivibrio]MDD9173685.1 aromatic amino acid transport family protein [Aliivibrio sp. S3TY1]MDD9178837.1 aromatic amino acid transport family protein [Aliivibrio sp. A6]MDD9190761.1 aromatic amino acid transport family protein [Aliivibrio sp. S2TY2]RYU46990.1 tyrosine transporter [Aliivibrio finisterrensis]RYU50173.1 tyrosine transporter [Aliivibrio finisterrensis]